ncbi:MAG: sigma-70 family RNA polymerase sigma factor [Firmicutes bacterium]|nr:sigma-70 family RNA polymerase sigma factor [Bacillota bacterium]
MNLPSGAPSDPVRPVGTGDSIRCFIERAQAGDASAREILVERNLKLAMSVARRFLNRGAELEDVYQAASMGLVKAVDNFDLTYNVAFSTYAVPVMVGEIRRYLDSTRLVKVGRAQAQAARMLMSKAAELEQVLGRSPTPAELAKETGIPAEDVVVHITSLSPVDSLDEAVSGSRGSPVALGETLGETINEDQILDNLALRQALAKLGEDDRKLVILRYMQNRNQMEVARLFGVSQSHVSRWEKRILAEVRALLEDKTRVRVEPSSSTRGSLGP